MELQILSPSKELYRGRVKSIVAPGTKGSFEMLINHAPIVSTLTKGTLVLTNHNNEKQLIPIEGGVVEQSNNKILLLVD